jgi:hypothetical protein
LFASRYRKRYSRCTGAIGKTRPDCIAAVPPRDLPDQRQPEASARGSTARATVKGREDALAVARVHARLITARPPSDLTSISMGGAPWRSALSSRLRTMRCNNARLPVTKTGLPLAEHCS